MSAGCQAAPVPCVRTRSAPLPAARRELRRDLPDEEPPHVHLRTTTAEFGYYAEDPYTESIEREPLDDRVEVVVIGGGFGGLIAGARLRQAGVQEIRVIEKAGDFGGTWYWNRYPGIETYTGHTFHTSRWDYGYTGGDANGGLHGLTDKKVAVIGTGATAIQCVPHLGRDAEHLYVFQRTPSSVDVRGNRPTDPEWATTLIPGWQRRRRDNFLAKVAGGDDGEDMVNDGWTRSAQVLRTMIPSGGRTDLPPEEIGLLAEAADFRKMNELRARVDEIVADPATAELLKPWYRYMCKRPTFSDEYLQTFNRPNVTLVDTAGTGGVERMTENAVVAGGVPYEVDCVIFATGFDVGLSSSERGLDIRGRDGVALDEYWKDGPRTLHGFYSHNFPNFFRLGAAQSAVSVNFVHILDEQATHLAEVVAEARKREARYVEPSAEAEAAWVATIREKAPDMRRFLAECTPGYYNNEGRPPERSETYGGGPIEFHELLRRWRADGGMREVIVE